MQLNPPQDDRFQEYLDMGKGGMGGLFPFPMGMGAGGMSVGRAISSKARGGLNKYIAHDPVGFVSKFATFQPEEIEQARNLLKQWGIGR